MPPKPGGPQWATFVFFNFLNPLLYAHHRYYRLKVQVDRMLEKKSVGFNLGVGLVFGATGYFLMTPLLPMYVNKTNAESLKDSHDLLTILNMDGRKELGASLLNQARDDVISRVYVAVDKIQVRRQKLAMEKDRELIEQLKEKQRAEKAAREAMCGARIQ